MKPFIRAASIVACFASLVLAVPSFAEDKVVAKVNGRSITEADVRLAEAEIGNDLGSIPAEQRRRVLVEYLIENHLLAEAAEGEKLGSGTAFDERMKYWQRRALRDAYFDKSVKGAVTEAEAKKLYDAQVAAAKPSEEARARHILVESEVKAKEIFEKIAHGEDFARMAKEHSKDPGSKEEGGDLGYFSRGQMVPQFEEAAFRLGKGDVSLPIKTQFGWHLIKVEDKRERRPPEFGAVKERITAALIHQRAQSTVDGMRAAARIDYVDPEVRAMVEAERHQGPARR